MIVIDLEGSLVAANPRVAVNVLVRPTLMLMDSLSAKPPNTHPRLSPFSIVTVTWDPAFKATSAS